MNINDREMLHIMEHVINNPYMGVIYINTDCEILLVNETFAEILGVDRDSIIGQPIQKIVPKSRLPHTVKTGEANLCELCMVNNKEMISMRVPIYSNGKIIGAMAKTLFLDISTARLLTDMISLNEDTARSSSKYQSKYTLDDIIGNNRRIVRLKTWSAQVANNSSNVLIIGESGTGKELFAHAIHHAGIRRNYPFIRINCASIPENLIESELFGYEEGAFTGALKGGKKANSNWPTKVQYSWMKSEKCPCPCRPSC